MLTQKGIRQIGDMYMYITCHGQVDLHQYIWKLMEPVGTSTAFSTPFGTPFGTAFSTPVSKGLGSYTPQTTLRLECSTANSTPLSTPFGTAFNTPFSTRDLHINEVSSAKRSANLNNWRTPNGTPNGTVFSTPKDLKLNTTNNTPLECSTTNSTPTNGVLFGVLHSLASFDTRNNTRNSTNMSTASP